MPLGAGFNQKNIAIELGVNPSTSAEKLKGIGI